MIIESIHRKIVNDLVEVFNEIYNHTNNTDDGKGEIYPICDILLLHRVFKHYGMESISEDLRVAMLDEAWDIFDENEKLQNIELELIKLLKVFCDNVSNSALLDVRDISYVHQSVLDDFFNEHGIKDIDERTKLMGKAIGAIFA